MSDEAEVVRSLTKKMKQRRDEAIQRRQQAQGLIDGAKVRRLRWEQGWLQADLAEVSGLARPTVSRIEKGRSMGSPYTAKRLAAALDIKVDEILLNNHSVEYDELTEDAGTDLPDINYEELIGE